MKKKKGKEEAEEKATFLLSKPFEDSLELTEKDRAAVRILVCLEQGQDLDALLMMLKSSGFQKVRFVHTHSGAIKRVTEQPFTHLILQASRTDMHAGDCIASLRNVDTKIQCIPASYQPSVDDVFSLLMMGARSFLRLPASISEVESAIVWTLRGEEYPDELLYASNRNRALVGIAFSRLDKVIDALRFKDRFSKSMDEFVRESYKLQVAGEMMRVFLEGDEADLLKEIQEFAIEKAEGPATQLGKTRSRLREKRRRRNQIV